MNSMRNKRSDIQVLRAIAIIAVVLIHTNSPDSTSQIVIRPFINFSVALFLFLSGYLTKLENSDWKSFCIKRVTRVFIPYAIWTVIYALFSGELMRIPINLATAGATGPFYYIFVYIQFVLLTPLLVKLAKSKRVYYGFIISPVALLLFNYPLAMTSIGANRLFSLFTWLNCLSWFTFYYLGLLLGNRIINVHYSIKSLSVLLAISIIMQMIESYVWLRVGASNIGTQSKITSLITSCIVLLIVHVLLTERRIKTENSFLLLTGDYSFGIYLIHPLLISLAFKYALTYYEHIPYLVNTAIILLMCFLICHLGNKLLPSKASRWLGLS